MVIELNEQKIGTRLMFGGNLVRQPYMVGRNFRTVGSLPEADRIMHNSFWIGVYPGLTEDHIAYMIEKIGNICKR